jgi:N-acetyl-alpha-D-muramate 1-phosphate uridylyltransferase
MEFRDNWVIPRRRSPQAQKMLLPVAILSGGLATRLRPLTEKIPKALVRVAGKPFVAWQLEYLRSQGANQVVLCIGYLGEQIEAAVGDGSAYGLEVRYSWDGPKLLGTGGALRQAVSLLGDRFFVFYGDSYLPVNFQVVQRSFLKCGKPALMTVLQNHNRWDKSNVLFRQGQILEYNKHRPSPEMMHIDYGLGILSASLVLDRLGNEPFDLADIYYSLSVRGDLAGLEVFDRFYEIGSEEGLQETEEFLARGKQW